MPDFLPLIPSGPDTHPEDTDPPRSDTRKSVQLLRSLVVEAVKRRLRPESELVELMRAVDSLPNL